MIKSGGRRAPRYQYWAYEKVHMLGKNFSPQMFNSYRWQVCGLNYGSLFSWLFSIEGNAPCTSASAYIDLLAKRFGKQCSNGYAHIENPNALEQFQEVFGPLVISGGLIIHQLLCIAIPLSQVPAIASCEISIFLTRHPRVIRRKFKYRESLLRQFGASVGMIA